MSPLLNTAPAVYAGASPAVAVYAGATKVWPSAGGPSPEHTVWGATIPTTSYQFNDGDAVFQLGDVFYLSGVSGWRVKGARLLINETYAAISSGWTVRFRCYIVSGTYTLPNNGGVLQSFGGAVAVKDISGAALVDGWNDVYFDTPVNFPSPGLAIVTVSVVGEQNIYWYGNPVRPDANSFQALDNAPLYYAETNPGAFLVGGVWSDDNDLSWHAIGTGTAFYCMDIIVDEG